MPANQEKAKPNKYLGLIELIISKMWEIMKINLFSVLWSIPAIFVMIYVTQWLFPRLGTVTSWMYTPEDMEFMEFLTRFAFGSALMTVPVVYLGPAAAGLTRVYKAVVARQPWFLWSDFWQTFKSTFWKTSLICVINVAVMILCGLALNFYIQYGEEFIPFLTGDLKLLVIGVVLLFLLLFLMMQLYIYQLMVQYNGSVIKTYRFSMVFALLRFFPNLLILVICGAITILPYYIHLLLGGAFYLFFSFGLSGIIINYFSWPAIHKHMEPLISK